MTPRHPDLRPGSRRGSGKQNIFRMIYNWYRILDQRDPHNLIYLSRQIPLLRERLIVLLSGGHDRVDMEALVAASAARPEVAG